MVAAVASLPVKRSTFSAATGPVAASAARIVRLANNDLEPLMVASFGKSNAG